jgi:glucose/arabinose dehydrogenase
VHPTAKVFRAPPSPAPMQAALLAVLLLLAGCSSPDPRQDQAPPPGTPTLRLEAVVTGLHSPVAAVHGQDGLLYIAEQAGTIQRWDGHELALFLDLQGLIRSGGEQGLLGLAFDPRDDDGRFVVDYTDLHGDTIVASYRGHAGSESEPGTLEREKVLLHIAQPYSNHNGGMVAFGPDGHLYVGMGDGGSGGDPQDRARNTTSLLGKILRIGLDCPPQALCLANTTYYTDGNPFAPGGSAPGQGAPEVWAYGLRNPWRFSFDRQTGDLWIGDVGQNAWEEIDRQPAGSRGGEDYGWSGMEGTHVYHRSRVDPGSVPPVWEYGHDGGSYAVTGGYVYRGHAIPALNGTYLYADYGSGKLWGLRPGPPATNSLLLATGRAIASFGEDPAGEVYVVDHDGGVYRLALG